MELPANRCPEWWATQNPAHRLQATVLEPEALTEQIRVALPALWLLVRLAALVLIRAMVFHRWRELAGQRFPPVAPGPGEELAAALLRLRMAGARLRTGVMP